MWWTNPTNVQMEYEMRLQDAEIARRNRRLARQVKRRKPILKRLFRRDKSSI